MSKVLYFNITYRCNSRCKFCFSNSTDINGKEMSYQDIFERLKKVSPTSNDLIVINGGEPTIHQDFYDIISKIQTLYDSEIVVYTNGTILDISRIDSKNKLSFTIPIHGTKKNHDDIVQIAGLYKKTLDTINKLNNAGFRYKIKFIINDEMISNNFEINEFLQSNNFSPEEIILARLNKTQKSKRNGVLIPTPADLKSYITSQTEKLKTKYHIKFLDIPFCYIDFNVPLVQYNGNIPSFFFNDTEHCMVSTNYYKDVMIGVNCTNCHYNNICSILKHSYLTLSLINNTFVIEEE